MMDDKLKAAIDFLLANGKDLEAEEVMALRQNYNALMNNYHAGQRASYDDGMRAALAAQPAPAAVPPAELTWLFTHCRAIGMVEGSESGKWEHDIALFTQRQAERIRVLREALVIIKANAGEAEQVYTVARAALEATK